VCFLSNSHIKETKMNIKKRIAIALIAIVPSLGFAVDPSSDDFTFQLSALVHAIAEGQNAGQSYCYLNKTHEEAIKDYIDKNGEDSHLTFIESEDRKGAISYLATSKNRAELFKILEEPSYDYTRCIQQKSELTKYKFLCFIKSLDDFEEAEKHKKQSHKSEIATASIIYADMFTTTIYMHVLQSNHNPMNNSEKSSLECESIKEVKFGDINFDKIKPPEEEQQ
jgi:hypothetical protein